MSTEVWSLFVAVFAGVMIAAISGVIVMFRQVGQLHTAIVGLTKVIDGYRQETRDDFARVHQRIDDLGQRPIQISLHKELS